MNTSLLTTVQTGFRHDDKPVITEEYIEEDNGSIKKSVKTGYEEDEVTTPERPIPSVDIDDVIQVLVRALYTKSVLNLNQQSICVKISILVNSELKLIKNLLVKTQVSIVVLRLINYYRKLQTVQEVYMLLRLRCRKQQQVQTLQTPP